MLKGHYIISLHQELDIETKEKHILQLSIKLENKKNDLIALIKKMKIYPLKH